MAAIDEGGEDGHVGLELAGVLEDLLDTVDPDLHCSVLLQPEIQRLLEPATEVEGGRGLSL